MPGRTPREAIQGRRLEVAMFVIGACFENSNFDDRVLSIG
jgi:hypothetical protein